MSKHPDDDLFASSTMSFGEHLEELRTSLFRALLGLLAGFAIGLFVANYVVEFIQLPLVTALTEYYGGKAREDLHNEYKGDPPPEMLNMIDEAGKIPETVDVDPFSFAESLKRGYPGQFDQFHLKHFLFAAEDVEPDKVIPLAKALEQGKAESKDSPSRAVWDVLSVEQRQVIESLAAGRRLDDAEGVEAPADGSPAGSEAGSVSAGEAGDRARLIRVLNELIEQPSLHQSRALQEEDFVGSLDATTRAAVRQLRGGLIDRFDADNSRRLNRLLVAFIYRDQIRKPRINVVPVTFWKDKEVRVQALKAHEAFMIWIKAAVISGLILSSPWIFWQIWVFVAAGLYPHERKYVWVFLPFSLFLFLAGAATAFFFVFQPVLDFLFSFNKAMNIDPDPRISEWMGFVLFLPLGFGISFQLPLVMLFLNRIGIFTVESYLSRWRIAVLVIFVLAMLLTPADPVSMLLMAIPLTVLYFGGIALCHWMPRIRSPYAVPDEP